MIIIVLEDNHLLGPMLCRRLEKRGHSVTLCTEIRQVENYFENLDSTERMPDCIVTDRDLPDGNGWEFCVRWVAHLPRIVFMTGNPPEKVSYPYFFKGVDSIDYLFSLVEKDS